MRVNFFRFRHLERCLALIACFLSCHKLKEQNPLRAAVCKYREFAVEKEIWKFFIFSQKKPFGETFSKITIKASKEFSFSRKPAKVKCCPTPYSRRSKTFELYYFQSPWEERRLKETSSSLAGK